MNEKENHSKHAGIYKDQIAFVLCGGQADRRAGVDCRICRTLGTMLDYGGGWNDRCSAGIKLQVVNRSPGKKAGEVPNKSVRALLRFRRDCCMRALNCAPIARWILTRPNLTFGIFARKQLYALILQSNSQTSSPSSRDDARRAQIS